jgi:uncharacterized membrane protein
MKLKHIWYISVVIVLLTAVPFTLYFLTYSGGESNLNVDWGTFGDFIGGVLNPIFALLNLIAFLYFTYIIYEFDKNSKDRELNYQRKLIYSGEKYELFKKINHSVNKIRFVLLSNDEKKADTITDLFENCDSSFADLKLLFPEINITDDEIKRIQDQFLVLIKEVQYVESQQSNDFSNAFNFTKEVNLIINILLKRIRESIENNLETA